MESSSVATIFRTSERWGAICYWKTRGRSGVGRVRFLVLSSEFLVLSSWFMVHGSWFMVLGAWCLQSERRFLLH
jgi:hypothetical protein